MRAIEKNYNQHQALITLISETLETLPRVKPRIAIVTPTWNTKTSWFVDLATSILTQTFPYWEWCIVDDCSSDTQFHDVFPLLNRLPNVRIIQLACNLGISGATNKGLSLATSPYICCVDHDDLLTSDSLESVVAKHEEGFDAVYTDSGKIDESGLESDPFYKPDWSPELFRGVMYVGHLLSFRRDIALEIGGFDKRFNGVQDFEFFLRYTEQAPKVGHVPKILYHWRMVPGSIATNSNAKGDVEKLQTKAVQEQLVRLGMPAIAIPGDYPHRVKILPGPRTQFPLISILIPTKDSSKVLSKCLYSIYSKSTYPRFEVICMDNETTEPEALEEMRVAPVTRVVFGGRFNFSRVNNSALNFASGSYLVFMNNDVEVSTPDWLENMLFYAEQRDVGAVGPLLLYPNNHVQHAGVVLGCRGTADHVMRMSCVSDGYAGSLSCAREVSAVTAACTMMRRDVFESVEGFNEHFFTIYQDVDLCLKIRQMGKRIIFTPRAQLYHHESLSRGSYYDFVDRNLLLDHWEPLILKGDPYYNPNFDVQACDYSLAKSQ